MRVLIIFIIFMTFLLAQERLINKGNNKMYSIQLGTFNTKDQALSFLMTLDEKIKKESFIYEVDDYITLRYKISKKVRFLRNSLIEIKKLGFKDSYIATSIISKLEKPINDIKQTIKTVTTKEEIQVIKKKINRFNYTKILNQAHNYKVNMNFFKSIEFYEKAYNLIKNNNSANNNLFYLYGKTNNWQKAKIRLLEFENKDVFLYSYSRGALEINNIKLESDIKPYLMYDNSGYTKLILGYHFEMNNNLKKASYYYKKAYKKNNIYLSFAYARFNEIIKNYKKAKFIYKYIYENIDTQSIILKDKAYKRYQELSKLKGGNKYD